MLPPPPEPSAAPAALQAFREDCQRFAIPSGGCVVILTAGGEISRNPALAEEPTPAGSIVKLVTAQVAAQQRCESLSRARECRGSTSWMAANGHIRHIRCWKPQGHGSLRLRDALAQSCNLFFFNLGREVSPAGFQAHASAAGFTATRLDTWRNPLSPLGDVPSLCISPRTAARWMLQLAQQSTEDAPCPLGQQQLRAGMLASVREGTAKAANVPGLQVAGKTGTATYADGSNRTWGWFVGWAYPLENRRRPLSIALRLPETAGPGKAAGLAGQILRTWKTRGCP